MIPAKHSSPRFALQISAIAALGLTLTLAPAPASAETKSYNFNSFTKLDISAGYEVIFTQGAQRSITIDSSDFSKVTVEQMGDTLHIGRPRNTNYRNHDRNSDVVRITAPDLEAAELNAGVDFRSDGLNVDKLKLDLAAGVEAKFTRLKARTLDLDINAGVNLDLSGECDAITVDAQAGVTVDAHDLKCKTANVDAGVGSTVNVHVSDKVIADAAVGASIDVSGSPKDVQKQTSLGGSVTIVR